MTDFYDTSVLVAAFWADHPSHGSCLRLLAGARPETSACCAHSLAEVYAVTTRMPVKPRVLPEQAMLFIEDVRSRLKIIHLDGAGYAAVLRESAQNRITGGRIYDAIILACARQADAGCVWTLNPADFVQIAPDLSDRIRVP